MPSKFTLRLTPTFVKDLKKIDKPYHKKIIITLKKLELDPFDPSLQIKKLKDREVGQWRLRVWPYRVRYDLIHTDIVLHRVRHRKDIYR